MTIENIFFGIAELAVVLIAISKPLLALNKNIVQLNTNFDFLKEENERRSRVCDLQCAKIEQQKEEIANLKTEIEVLKNKNKI